MAYLRGGKGLQQKAYFQGVTSLGKVFIPSCLVPPTSNWEAVWKRISQSAEKTCAVVALNKEILMNLSRL